MGLLLVGAGSVLAVEVVFKAVAPGVYAFVGDTEGRTYENEALNANFGLVVTPQGAVLIDPGASFQGARQIAAAAQKVTTQPIRWVINTGGQDHRWLGNGYFQAQGAEIIAHANAQADMKTRGPAHLKANAPVLKDKMAGTEIVFPPAGSKTPTPPSTWAAPRCRWCTAAGDTRRATVWCGCPKPVWCSPAMWFMWTAS